jgi:cell division septum initiation protein DivIVA
MDTVTLARENTLLKARLAQVEAALAESQDANRRLEDILRTSQREKFGKRSEKLSPDQFNLPLEDAELAQGVLEAAQEKAEAALQRARGEEPRKPKRNRGHLPTHLPRIERVIEPASTLCPCGVPPMKWSTNWDSLIPISGGPRDGWQARQTRRHRVEAAAG